jgi:ferredoxin
MPVVRFVPLGIEREVRSGTTILSAANAAGAPLGQSCSGDGVCGWCRVRILSGGEHVAPVGELEGRVISEKEFAADERAACLARVMGNLSITTTYWGNE